jgi:hypothetical protein
MAVSALEFMSEAIDALMRADAARLERLAAEAPSVPPPAGGLERDSVMGKRRAFVALLALTRRNLRLLRGNPARPEEYGPARG